MVKELLFRSPREDDFNLTTTLSVSCAITSSVSCLQLSHCSFISQHDSSTSSIKLGAPPKPVMSLVMFALQKPIKSLVTIVQRMGVY